MKVGVITLFGNYNYGNRLQNYAVQTILEEHGCEVDTIVCPGSYCKNILRDIRDFWCLFQKKESSARLKAFKKFNKDFLHVRYEYNKEKTMPLQIKNEYAFFFVGSDQVWNPQIRKTERSVFFLQFANANQKRCISPSIGVEKIDDIYVESYSEWLEDFKYLSCREDIGAKELTRVTGKECIHLIDPTLVLEREDWRRLEDISTIPNEAYIVLFFLGEIEINVRKQIIVFAQKKGYKIIELNSTTDKYYSVGPRGFLALIDNAKLVCTDSFHAVAFSINFNTPFYVFNRTDKRKEANNTNSRIESLLKQFSLEDRYGLKKQISCECNFKEANVILVQERGKFREYIRNCLENGGDD